MHIASTVDFSGRLPLSPPSVDRIPTSLTTMFVCLLAVLVVFSGALFAQESFGTIAGTVLGPTAQPLAAHPVTLRNVQSGRAYPAVTTDTGSFRLEALPVGSYRVELEEQGIRLDFAAELVQAGQVIDVGLLRLQNPEALAPAAPTAVATPDETLSGGAGSAETLFQEVTVTARRIEETAQEVPIPLSVVDGETINNAGAFNVNRLKELVPTVQFYSSNPRNTAVTIRGLGSPYGLTNDGIEPGVGFYVDGVFYARPAAGTIDFLDLERIEVLRGPQGTLFGKNTTAGAINITTRRPTFTPETNFEVSFGNFGYIQAKGSISGPIGKKVAARLSFSGTQRDGMLYNVRTQDDVNDLNNQGVRGQVLIVPTDRISILFAADYTRQRPEGYAQVIAGVAPTLRAANRQWAQIAADLNYAPPSYNAFDRRIDTDTPWRSDQDMGGASVTVDWTKGPGVLTSISAWRKWDWRPSNDRDFIGLPVTTQSAAPSIHNQWTQELRYAAAINSRINFVAGGFFFGQKLDTSPFHVQEQGAAAARVLLAPSALASTPGLLDGYGQNINFRFNTVSAAGFGQVDFNITERLRITPGLRFNYDSKDLDYDQQVFGGLDTTDPALIALKRSILSPLKYKADVTDNNVSGQITVAYKASANINTYGTYATGFKSVGLNLGGVPTDAAGNPIVSAATVRPEDVRNIEFGVKTRLFRRLTANLAAFNTTTNDFQTQVVNAQVGLLRGYLANAEKVRVRGFEFDGNARITKNLSVYANLAFTDGRYIAFRDAPAPLEETGGPQAKDVSGSVLPGISRWAGAYGGEYTLPKTILGGNGEFFIGSDSSFRSKFSSSPSFSRYLVVDGYGLVNLRAGYRSKADWSVSLWARNLTGTNYYELLSAVPGNSGLYAGLPGDMRTFGITLRRTFSKKEDQSTKEQAKPTRARLGRETPESSDSASTEPEPGATARISDANPYRAEGLNRVGGLHRAEGQRPYNPVDAFRIRGPQGFQAVSTN